MAGDRAIMSLGTTPFDGDAWDIRGLRAVAVHQATP
jgi:hypothetical protein